MPCVSHLEITKKILNLGCGNDMFGTHRVDRMPTIATTHVFDVEKGLMFPDEYFDEIYERNLLEHLRNVGFHLEECYRVLKKGGILTLITDNAACTRFYTFGTHTGRYEKLRRETNPDDRHYGIFTVNHLRNHLEKVGFQIQTLNTIGTDTIGRFLDKFSRTKPRILAVARK